MLQPNGEWKLEDFQRIALDGNVEILMHTSGNQALIAWPWWANEDAIADASWHAQSMGFVDIREVGNLQGYSVPEFDCDDWDFMLLDADL